MKENDISAVVIDAALKVHRELGPGLLEFVYEVALAHELTSRGFQVKRQMPIPITYAGIKFEEGFKADILVDDKVILELKAIEKVLPVHKKQLLTYLKLTNMKLGLLLNFNVSLMKEGIHRTVNGLSPD